MTVNQRPQMDARNLDGNMFSIAAAVRQTLRTAGQHDQAKLVIPAMTSSKSPEEAMAKFMEMVDFVWYTPIGEVCADCGDRYCDGTCQDEDEDEE